MIPPSIIIPVPFITLILLVTLLQLVLLLKNNMEQVFLILLYHIEKNLNRFWKVSLKAKTTFG
jgi:hypothetical protein